MATISSHMTLTIGATATAVTLDPIKFTKGFYLICPTANSGSVYLGDSAVDNTYPTVPKSDSFTDSLLVTASSLSQGYQLYLRGSGSGQLVYVYPG